MLVLRSVWPESFENVKCVTQQTSCLLVYSTYTLFPSLVAQTNTNSTFSCSVKSKKTDNLYFRTCVCVLSQCVSVWKLEVVTTRQTPAFYLKGSVLVGPLAWMSCFHLIIVLSVLDGLPIGAHIFKCETLHADCSQYKARKVLLFTHPQRVTTESIRAATGLL